MPLFGRRARRRGDGAAIDAATGLPLRAAALAAAAAPLERRRPVAILHVGVERGDLADVAGRVRRSVKERDTVARVGERGLAIVLVGGPAVQRAMDVARRVHGELDGAVTIGVAATFRERVTAEQLLARAERAVAASDGRAA